VTEGERSEKRPARWKGVARVLVAVLLLGAVLEFFVSWRDRVAWPSRYGAAPLVGTLEVGVKSSRFACDRGERAGTTLEFIPSTDAHGGLWDAVVETRPDGKQERSRSTTQRARRLEKQPEEGL
jgi:hypothetical protein